MGWRIRDEDCIRFYLFSITFNQRKGNIIEKKHKSQFSPFAVSFHCLIDRPAWVGVEFGGVYR